MGRNPRSRIEYAKTITWYDYCFGQLNAFEGIKTDYALTKFLYADTDKNKDNNLFKRYKYGLSTPQIDWINIVESKVIGSSNIINHQIWNNLKNCPRDEESILIQLQQLPTFITKHLFDESFSSMRDFNREALVYISKFNSLDSLSALYLLHRWGCLIGSHPLVNDSYSFILSGLCNILKINMCLDRSHILLFDELFEQIFVMNVLGYNTPVKAKFNWRESRVRSWDESTKNLSIKEESLLLKYPEISQFINRPLS
ncbi:hypothetical protein [Acinetobacter haemolyticus]|uniref:hypothetical protein n=1 Tax=Acinetobacter haemolyticus TaxID=29430 RepID=UPI0002D0853C|nr:hypothetical protein [Acinetobacter haemolyticus]ENW19550.1 hypothetical protein F926_02299 [Acinetobacter haemolyticus NIPH 261]